MKEPVNALADSLQQSSIFGGARPRDEKLYEEKRYSEQMKERLGSTDEDQAEHGETKDDEKRE